MHTPSFGQSTAPSLDTSAAEKLVVKRIEIAGADAIPATDLLRESGFIEGLSYSIGELRAIAIRITGAYRQRGYFLAQTFLPPQEILDGLVRFQVLEGKFGKVDVRNRSNLSDSTSAALTQDLAHMGAVKQQTLERRLLLLADIPGVQVKSSLTPGSTLGTTDLTLDLSSAARWNASLEADNHGNSYTGEHRLGGTVSLSEPLGIGDQAAVRALSGGQGLAYGRASYQAMAGWVTLGLSYTELQYQLSGTFASANIRGSARTHSLFASYPLIRTKDTNLNVQWSLDKKNFSDSAGTTAPTEKRSTASIVSIRGDFLDAQGTGQVNYHAMWTRGKVHLLSAAALAADLATAQSSGGFDKVTYALSYQKAMAADTVFYLSLNGQSASKNLDSSEKFSLGGAQGVRAYPSGEASGDEGAAVTLELRTGLPKLNQQLNGQLQWIAFMDAGVVTIHKRPWDTSVNSRSLRAGGFGLAFQSHANWSFKAYYAVKFNSGAATTEADSRGRLWIQTARNF